MCTIQENSDKRKFQMSLKPIIQIKKEKNAIIGPRPELEYFVFWKGRGEAYFTTHSFYSSPLPHFYKIISGNIFKN